MKTQAIGAAFAAGISRPDARRIRRLATIAARHGGRVWLVGGPLRDLLLGRRLTDLDLAIDGAVQRIARAVAREFAGAVRWHPRFSTATVSFPGGHLDLAATRTETYAAPGALPRVARGSIEEDLARRDFSVNAMALEILPRGHGDLIDPFDARADLRSGTLRVLHEGSFADDPTRAFRAARFAVRFGFRVERATLAWMRASIARGEPSMLSGERVAAEIRRALNEPRPGAVFGLLARWKLGPAWDAAGSPSTAGLTRLRYANARLRSLQTPSDDDTALKLGVTFHDLSRIRRTRIANRLRVKRSERRFLVDAPDRAREIRKRLRRASGRHDVGALCLAGETDALVLAALLAGAADFAKLRRGFRRARQAVLRIDGHDLLRAGVPRGAGLARGLAAARRACLAGRATTRAAQLEAALRELRET